MAIKKGRVAAQNKSNRKGYATSGKVEKATFTERHQLNPNKKYKNRTDENYLKALLWELQPENICKFASVPTEGATGAKKNLKIVEMEYMGLAATTLLGGVRKPKQGTYAHKVMDAFKYLISEEGLGKLEKLGCRLKLRMVIPYPYQAYCIALIKASYTQNWDKTEQHNYNLDPEPALSGHEFLKSDLYESIITFLQRIQECLNSKIGFLHPNKCLHSFSLRFSLLPITASYLRINSVMVTDPYVYAERAKKQESDDTNNDEGIQAAKVTNVNASPIQSVFSDMPLLVLLDPEKFAYQPNITTRDGKSLYEVIHRQFSYHFVRDISIFPQDCTGVNNEHESIRGLDNLKTPDELLSSADFYGHKIKRIIRKNALYEMKAENPTQDLIERWISGDGKDRVEDWREAVATRFDIITQHPKLRNPAIYNDLRWPKEKLGRTIDEATRIVKGSPGKPNSKKKPELPISSIATIEAGYDQTTNEIFYKILDSLGNVISGYAVNKDENSSILSVQSLGKLLHLLEFGSLKFIIDNNRGKNDPSRQNTIKSELMDFLEEKAKDKYQQYDFKPKALFQNNKINGNIKIKKKSFADLLDAKTPGMYMLTKKDPVTDKKHPYCKALYTAIHYLSNEKTQYPIWVCSDQESDWDNWYKHSCPDEVKDLSPKPK